VVHGERDCQPVHLGYKADNIMGQAISTSGGWIVDDLHLPEAGCKLVAYEIGAMAGAFSAELRPSCSGLPIPGTRVQMIIDGPTGLERRVIRRNLEFPVNLPQNVSIAVQSNRGVIIAGESAEIGSTADFFELQEGDGTCKVLSGPNPYQPASLHVSLICEGAPPKGACCDYVLEQCAGGERDGARCRNDADCPGGFCASQCRETTKANCPFHPDIGLRWTAGSSCDHPSPNAWPCGRYACCYEENEVQQCEDLSHAQCLAKHPMGVEEKWMKGRYCGMEQLTCPYVLCFGATGECDVPHSTPGCVDEYCCGEVCSWDDFCCSVEWDTQCVDEAYEADCFLFVAWDTCLEAKAVPVPIQVTGPHIWASPLDTSEIACCHNGSPLACRSGPAQYRSCQSDDDCQLYGGKTCEERPPFVFGGLWYKFVAASTSARIHTWFSSSINATDSIIQVFAVADSSTPESECESLMPIACADDSPGCGPGGKLSDVCADGLTVGDTYYILIGGKSYETRGEYRLTISSTPCSAAHNPVNDSCFAAATVSEGSYSFDLTAAELDCPRDYCDLFAEADVWFDYTATVSDVVAVDTCSLTVPGATRILIYEGCDRCPPLLPAPIACMNWPCNSGEGVFDFFLAEAGQCYRIRVTTGDATRPAGTLLIAPQSP
jgi:hypothetical protein